MKDFTATSISWAGEVQDCIYTDTELTDRVNKKELRHLRESLWETGIKEYSCDLCCNCSACKREFSAVSAIHQECWALVFINQNSFLSSHQVSKFLYHANLTSTQQKTNKTFLMSRAKLFLLSCYIPKVRSDDKNRNLGSKKS